MKTVSTVFEIDESCQPYSGVTVIHVLHLDVLLVLCDPLNLIVGLDGRLAFGLVTHDFTLRVI